MCLELESFWTMRASMKTMSHWCMEFHGFFWTLWAIITFQNACHILKGVLLPFGQNRLVLENLQILNRWSKIDSDFFNRTLDAPKRAWTIVSWPQRSYRFLSADKQRGLLNLRIRSTGATVDRFWCVDYYFDGNGLNKSLQVFVLWYLSLEDRKALSCERQFFRKSFISEISL